MPRSRADASDALGAALADGQVRPRRRGATGRDARAGCWPAARVRALDRRDDRDAGARRPRRLLPAPTSASGPPPSSLGTASAAALAAVRGTGGPGGAYAVQYLWATGDHAVNQLPPSRRRERSTSDRCQPPTHRPQDSPVGPLTLVATGDALVAVWMQDQRHHPGTAAHGAPAPAGDSLLRRVAGQLEAYFAGERTEFDLPLAPARHAVPAAGLGRARARSRTARPGPTASSPQQLGSPGGSRAVGLANGRNPIGIIVPCHRVVGADRQPHRLRRRPGAQAAAARPREPGGRAPALLAVSRH